MKKRVRVPVMFYNEEAYSIIDGPLFHKRYSSEHYWGARPFTLKEYTPHEDESKFLLLKVLEQAVRDYISLRKSKAEHDKINWASANSFLFEDEHSIDFGDHTLNLDQVLTLLELDRTWIQEEVEDLRRVTDKKKAQRKRRKLRDEKKKNKNKKKKKSKKKNVRSNSSRTSRAQRSLSRLPSRRNGRKARPRS